ncbi:DNA-3-methyladenine glycosylase I [Serratia sp. NPDC078593]|uniref:DNA-3-methyladenine glycosylase I n=1 Tax=unclassified Serratia (in: enterobacteria) TaxID=2647522 RepID=UPI0037D004E5
MTNERCGWVTNDPLYLAYHDDEWGVPTTDAQELFEMLCLEGQQAGLSWITVLKKRENYRRAFHQFDPQRVAAMTEHDVATLLQDAGIIRHRGKIEAIITNARAYLAMQEAGEDFVTFIWSFVDGQPQRNQWHQLSQVPAKTEQSDAMSKALKKRGFKFIGSTICYAFMQASGLVNDHLTGCCCYPKPQQASSAPAGRTISKA